jgi:hypothetical protein
LRRSARVGPSRLRHLILSGMTLTSIPSEMSSEA